MNHLNYNHLYSFYVVARAGSLKNAAINLGVSQSTLSEQIKGFERQIASPLFTRVGRSLSLNAQGRHLFDRIDSFFSKTADLADIMTSERPSAGHAVEIGITTTISKTFSFELLRPIFTDENVVTRVTESTIDSLLVEFKKQEIDILITHERISPTLIKRLTSVSLREPDLIVVGAKKFKHLSSGFPKGLSGCPFFLFTPRTPLRWETEKFFRGKNICPRIKGEVDDTDLLRAAAVNGLGLTVLPTRAVHRELAERKLFEIGGLPKGDIHIFAYHAGGDVAPSVERVMTILRENQRPQTA